MASIESLTAAVAVFGILIMGRRHVQERRMEQAERSLLAKDLAILQELENDEDRWAVQQVIDEQVYATYVEAVSARVAALEWALNWGATLAILLGLWASTFESQTSTALRVFQGVIVGLAGLNIYRGLSNWWEIKKSVKSASEEYWGKVRDRKACEQAEKADA